VLRSYLDLLVGRAWGFAAALAWRLCRSPPAGPFAVPTLGWLCCLLPGCGYATQLSPCTRLENSPKAGQAVFHWAGCLDQFSAKMGTEGAGVQEEVEQRRRRKGTVPGHSPEALGHLLCNQTVRKVSAGSACSAGVCRSGVCPCNVCWCSLCFPHGLLHLSSSAVICLWHWAAHKRSLISEP